MAMTIEVKPDFSAFRQASAKEVMEAVQCDRATAEQFIEHFWAVPR